MVSEQIKPTMFWATEQWFASVEGFSEAAMDAISKLVWSSSQMKSKIMTKGTWEALEILCYEQADEKSDVYNYGVVLWEITTEKILWDDLNPMQIDEDDYIIEDSEVDEYKYT